MPDSPGDDGIADALWRAARRGDGAAFIALSGGLAIANKKRPAQGKIERRPAPYESKTAIITTSTGTFVSPLKTWKIRGLAVILNYPRYTAQSDLDAQIEPQKIKKREFEERWLH